MGFWGKIFGGAGKREEGVKEEVTVDSEDSLSKLLDKEYENHSKMLSNDVRPKYDEIQNAVDALDANLKGLQNAEHPKEVDKDEMNQRILLNASSAKKRFIESMKILVKELRRPVNFDSNSILKFHDSCTQIVKNINASTSKDYLSFKEIFQREASMVYSDVKKIDELFRSLSKTIANRKDRLDVIEKAKEDLKKMKGVKNSIELKRKDTELLEKKSEDLKKEVSVMENSVSDLNSSRQMEELDSLSKEKDGIKAAASQKSNEILQNMSVLGKAVKKFKKLVDDGATDFQNKKYLDNFLVDPVDATLQHGSETFYTMLKAIEKAIDEHKIDLGERLQKTLDALTSLEQTGLISRLIGDLKDFNERFRDIDEKISKSKIRDNIQKIKSDMNTVKTRLDENEKNIADNKSATEKLENNLVETKKSLEGHLKLILGKDVKLAF